MSRAEREAEWLRLTREVMPALARERGWPVRLDHCFQRILLDAELGSPWTKRLAGRPAYRSVDDATLDNLIARAEAVIAGEADLHALNRESLAGRGSSAADPPAIEGEGLWRGPMADFPLPGLTFLTKSVRCSVPALVPKTRSG